MKIVIFGGEGFLGTKLNKIFTERGHIVLSIDHKPNSKHKIDATNFHQVLNFLDYQKPNIIIDTIALTSSVECEKNPLLAKKLNFTTAKNISLAAKKIHAKLFFISSSYVFNGKKGDYTERDEPSPEGVYAKTKLIAEKELSKEKNNTILRVDLLYGYNSKNKPNGIFEKILSNKDIFIGNPNQIRSPLFIEDIPEIIEKLYLNLEKGIFHLAGPEKIKMIDFLKKLEFLVRKDSKIFILKEKNLLVKPLKNSTLKINKITQLNIKTTCLEEGLTLIKKQLK